MDKDVFDAHFRDTNGDIQKLGNELIELSGQVMGSIQVRRDDRDDVRQDVILAMAKAAKKTNPNQSPWSYLFCVGQRAAWASAGKRLKQINMEASMSESLGGLFDTCVPMVIPPARRMSVEKAIEIAMKRARQAMDTLEENDPTKAFCRGVMHGLTALRDSLKESAMQKAI